VRGGGGGGRGSWEGVGGGGGGGGGGGRGMRVGIWAVKAMSGYIDVAILELRATISGHLLMILLDERGRIDREIFSVTATVRVQRRSHKYPTWRRRFVSLMLKKRWHNSN